MTAPSEVADRPAGYDQKTTLEILKIQLIYASDRRNQQEISCHLAAFGLVFMLVKIGLVPSTGFAKNSPAETGLFQSGKNAKN